MGVSIRIWVLMHSAGPGSSLWLPWRQYLEPFGWLQVLRSEGALFDRERDRKRLNDFRHLT